MAKVMFKVEVGLSFGVKVGVLLVCRVCVKESVRSLWASQCCVFMHL